MSIFKYDFYPAKIKWFLDNGFEELEPLDYYRMLFPVGSFQNPGESNGDFKSNGILQFRNPGDSASSMRTSIIYDDHHTIRDCLECQGVFADREFALVSACAYLGRHKTKQNARYCYGLIIDIDAVDVNGVQNLYCMACEGIIPMPTAIVVSGNGIHVSYMFDVPVPLYANKAEKLFILKSMLSRKIWNEKVSSDPDFQNHGLVQGYRMVGSETKKGHIVKAFKTGGKISVEELISSVNTINDVSYLKPNKGTLFSERIGSLIKDKSTSDSMFSEFCSDHQTLAELRTDNPVWFEDWYKRRVIEKEKPGHLHIGRKPYDKWLNEIKIKAHQGNRKRCIYCLAAFAQKCDIPEEEFIRDAYSLLEPFDAMTIDPNNHFRKSDIDAVIEQFRSLNLTRMSLRAMYNMTGIEYPTEKKNRKADGSTGAPDKEELVKKYLSEHPDETNIAKIASECGCSRPTVYKYLIKSKEKQGGENDEKI